MWKGVLKATRGQDLVLLQMGMGKMGRLEQGQGIATRLKATNMLAW